MKPMTVLAPLGMLGYGIPARSMERGLARERLSEVHALALPARQRAQRGVPDVGHAHRCHRPADELVVGRAHASEEAEIREAPHADDVNATLQRPGASCRTEERSSDIGEESGMRLAPTLRASMPTPRRRSPSPTWQRHLDRRRRERVRSPRIPRRCYRPTPATEGGSAKT